MTTPERQLSFRVASKVDLEGALKILDDNHRGSLSEDGLKDGFISVRFTLSQLIEMADNGITVVAVSGDTIAGVLSAQTCQYNLRNIPLLAKMVEVLSGKLLVGQKIETETSIVCGPVCVDKEFRGKGLFQSMYTILEREAKPSFPIGLTVISQTNPRSLRAHEKIGMQKITSFEFDGRTFDALAMRFDRASDT